jgi:hypothetical protein
MKREEKREKYKNIRTTNQLSKENKLKKRRNN